MKTYLIKWIEIQLQKNITPEYRKFLETELKKYSQE